MSDEVNAAAGEGSPIVEILGNDKQSGSVMDAARTLASFRLKQREQAPISDLVEAIKPDKTESGEQPEPATAEAQPSGEQTEAADTSQDETPIDPPKSWTKEAKERFAALPRETQEYLSAREEERDRDISRRQTEIAEQRKATEAERVKAEQARQQFESRLPELLQALDAQRMAQFADIKTDADVTKMAAEDWPRYVQWDAAQKQMGRAREQAKEASERQATEYRQNFENFVKSESDKFAEKVPEFTDKTKKAALQEKAVTMLRDLGFHDDELGKLGRGEMGVSLYDHRLQLLINDGIKFREAQAASKAARLNNLKPVPPVQRPGVSQGRGAAQDAVIQNLTKQLDKSGSAKDAARLLTERRKAAG